MRGRRCTIDSSCLIALDHVQLIPSLSLLFSKVLVPKAVRAELFRRRATKDRIRAILADYAFFERCDGYEQAAVSILLVEQRWRGGRDRGEAEAIVQAAQVGAVVIVDDRWGRDLARQYELECHGTLWVLERLYEIEVLSATVLRDNLRALVERGIRLPPEATDALLVRIGQERIFGHQS
jgi:predicted nucleic acid-binding protein